MKYNRAIFKKYGSVSLLSIQKKLTKIRLLHYLEKIISKKRRRITVELFSSIHPLTDNERNFVLDKLENYDKDGYLLVDSLKSLN